MYLILCNSSNMTVVGLPQNSQSHCDLCQMHWTGNVHMSKHLWREHMKLNKHLLWLQLNQQQQQHLLQTQSGSKVKFCRFFQQLQRKKCILGCFFFFPFIVKEKTICFELKVLSLFPVWWVIRVTGLPFFSLNRCCISKPPNVFSFVLWVQS